MKIIMLGAPGAGKGTQAKQIAAKYEIPHISTGDIFRANIKEGTELGKKAKAFMDKGELVPDELTCDLVVDRISKPDAAKGYVLDGFPRTIPQAEALTKALEARGEKIDYAINVEVPDENIVHRMGGRRACIGCGATYHVEFNAPKVEDVCDTCGGELVLRDDDKPETVQKRLSVYHAQTQPLIDYYKKANVLVEVDGTEDINVIFQDIVKILAAKRMSISIKTAREIEKMRRAGELLEKVHDELGRAIHPGMSTWEINKLGEEMIRSFGCTPNFLNYNGYPASICVSVNEEVVHGIPSKKRILKEGDIVSLDAGLIYEGYHSDAARTHAVGEISPEARKLVEVTRQAFFEGIKYAKAGHHLHEISAAIGAYAESFGYGVVRDLVGHGIGTHLHEDPAVPNFAQPSRGVRLQPGMTLAIEPMITAGGYAVRWLDDDWTVVTEDGSLAAHYENTILITEGEPEILTLSHTEEDL